VLAGGIGYVIGNQGCPDHDSEECDFAGFNGLMLGAVLGSVAGYTTYAIVDVASNASVLREKPLRPTAALQFWLRPQASRERQRADNGVRWDGLQLGVTWRL
jgi:hypothetical protein